MVRTLLAMVLAVTLAGPASAQVLEFDPRAKNEEKKDPRAEQLAKIERQREQAGNLLGLYTKLLASGVFVCGRTAEDFIENDLRPASRGMLSIDGIEFEVDEENKRVTAVMGDFAPRTAVYVPGYGCTLLPKGADEVFFETPEAEAETEAPDPAEIDWPTGDRNAVRVPEAVNASQITELLDQAFDDSLHDKPQRTRALLVVYDGRIVAERYAPGFDRDTRHISWSMGKSIQSALTGILVKQGEFTVDDPAPIPEWRRMEDDPRRNITIANLLHMSGGLDWERASPISNDGFTSADDHSRVYFGALNVYDYSINTPLRYKPGAVWRYLNCDPLSLGWIMKDIVTKRGEEYLTFPKRTLFGRIGMRNMVLECDAWGNFIMTGFDYGTARDWARFGLLHLNDGMWEGERILPEGWVDFVRTPAPAAEGENYGALFWLNRGGMFESLPADMYFPAGHHSQHVFIIPSRDVVIVRLGHSVEGGFNEYMEPIMKGILDALPGG